MRMRFKSLLFIILFLFIFTASVGVGYLFYHEAPTDSDIVIDGDITINYLSGKTFKLNGDNEISFSVTNNDSEQKYYYIQLTDVYAKDVSYELKSSDNFEKSDALKSDIISNQISIEGNKTINYTIKFQAEDNKEYSGTIKVGVKVNENNTFADVILANNKVGDVTLSNIGDTATLDEGLQKKEDDIGPAYYFRGAVSNNFVTFANFTWKIVKINGDGSVKLVLDGILPEISKYYESDTEFLNTPIYKQLESWYNGYLSNYSDYITYYKYCDDKGYDSNKTTLLAYNRIITNKIPSFVCLGNALNSKIGLLTADEVSLAGGSNVANTSYYLYNENIKTSYYTMTASSINATFNPFVVNADGSLVSDVSGTLLRGVRPVINITKNAKVSGSGTYDDPYTIISNKN